MLEVEPGASLHALMLSFTPTPGNQIQSLNVLAVGEEWGPGLMGTVSSRQGKNPRAHEEREVVCCEWERESGGRRQIPVGQVENVLKAQAASRVFLLPPMGSGQRNSTSDHCSMTRSVAIFAWGNSPGNVGLRVEDLSGGICMVLFLECLVSPRIPSWC